MGMNVNEIARAEMVEKKKSHENRTCKIHIKGKKKT